MKSKPVKVYSFIILICNASASEVATVSFPKYFRCSLAILLIDTWSLNHRGSTFCFDEDESRRLHLFWLKNLLWVLYTSFNWRRANEFTFWQEQAHLFSAKRFLKDTLHLFIWIDNPSFVRYLRPKLKVNQLSHTNRPIIDSLLNYYEQALKY